jgi:TetR/AcrR family transcriptional regulator
MSTTSRPRGRPRREDSPVDVDALLDAALRAFAAHGYDGMSVRTLNRELGVSHNLVHQRYGSKRGLWDAAIERGFGGLVHHLESGIDPTLTDPLEQLHAAIVRFVEYSAEHPELTGIMNSEGALGGERLDHIFDTYIAPATAPVGLLLEHLAREGTIRPIPLRTFHVLVTSGGAAPFSLVALAERFDPTSPLEPAEVARHARLVADLLVAGLRLET